MFFFHMKYFIRTTSALSSYSIPYGMCDDYTSEMTCFMYMGFFFSSLAAAYPMENIKMMLPDCSACPPGQYVESFCNRSMDRTCKPCPYSTYSKSLNNNTFCTRCQRCKRKEVVEFECTQIKDTICTCEKGYIYDPHKPCRPCPKGFIAKKNTCLNETDVDPGGTPRSTDAGEKIAIVVGIVAGTIITIVLIICVAYWLFKRRQRMHKNQPPDLVKEATATPPLPPKKMLRRQNENDYTPTPVACKPLIPRKLAISNLDMSLVQDLNMLLSTAYTINYKHLAGKLGYTFQYVKLFENEKQPVEALLDHFCSGSNATKERLYEALIAIGRHDVAHKVWLEL